MSKRDAYETAASQIVREAEETLQRYVDRCRTMTPEQLASEPRRLIGRLSTAQYAEVVRAVTGDQEQRRAFSRPAAQPRKTQQRTHVTLSRRWRRLSNSGQAGMIGALVGLGAAAGITLAERHAAPIPEPSAPVRSRDATRWPYCQRLSPTVDGCLYVAQTDLDWARAAALLDQPELMLRANNSHLAGSIVPKGARLLVWRSLGRIQD